MHLQSASKTDGLAVALCRNGRPDYIPVRLVGKQLAKRHPVCSSSKCHPRGLQPHRKGMDWPSLCVETAVPIWFRMVFGQADHLPSSTQCATAHTQAAQEPSEVESSQQPAPTDCRGRFAQTFLSTNEYRREGRTLIVHFEYHPKTSRNRRLGTTGQKRHFFKSGFFFSFLLFLPNVCEESTNTVVYFHH